LSDSLVEKMFEHPWHLIADFVVQLCDSRMDCEKLM
jgi:hypothetical protein